MTDKVIFITTTGLSTWQVPGDWTNVNSIECIGGGAAGCVVCNGTGAATGGGGGAYSKQFNVDLTPGANVPVFVAVGGAAFAFTGTGGNASTNYEAYPACGQSTRFNDSISTNSPDTYANGSGNGNNYTMFSLTQKVPNGATITKIGVGAASAGDCSVKIAQRQSATSYSVAVSQSFSHGGTGYEDCTLSTPYTIPPYGDWYIGLFVATGQNVGFGVVSCSRAYIQSDVAQGAVGTLSEDTGGCHCVRWTGYKMADATVSAAGAVTGTYTFTSTIAGGNGGDKAVGVGAIKNAGGRGGNYTQGSGGLTATGGGGAAGSHGDGNPGSDLTGNGGIQASAGGQGDSTSGGAGSAGSTSGNPSNGSAGNEYTQTSDSTTAGPGGGGGGVSKATNQTAGSGGNYGAGGGAAASTATSSAETSGAGTQGIIIITYTPANIRQTHYRFRTDSDGADATPTWGSNEDTP